MPSSEDCATLKAYVDGVDHTAREHEAEWGMGRLPLLVDAELRAKFERQSVRWLEALETAWSSKMLTRDQLEAVATRSAAMQRAWQALAAAASEAGARPIRPHVWEARLPDGTVAAIVQTAAEVPRVIADGRHVVVWTVDEIASVIGNVFPQVINEAKRVFPGAKVAGRVDRAWGREGDPIPFGDQP